MPGIVLLPVRLSLVLVWILLGLATVILCFPVLRASARRWLIRNWSRVLLLFCGVRVQVSGQPKKEGAALWVANHVSWLDIFVMNSVRAVSFIAKSDIRQWPLIGWLVAGAGTLFIERGRRHAVRAVGQQMNLRFRQGEVVGLFPEGTTSPGLDVAPFHSSLFEPALRAGVDVQPVALLFRQHGMRTDAFAYVGEQSLVENVWVLLKATGTRVDIVFCPVIPAAECLQLGRAALAARAAQDIHSLVTAGPA